MLDRSTRMRLSYTWKSTPLAFRGLFKRLNSQTGEVELQICDNNGEFNGRDCNALATWKLKSICGRRKCSCMPSAEPYRYRSLCSCSPYECDCDFQCKCSRSIWQLMFYIGSDNGMSCCWSQSDQNERSSVMWWNILNLPCSNYTIIHILSLSRWYGYNVHT
jgi:hypothetical protein